MTTMMDQGKGTTTMEAAIEVSVATRGQKTEWHQRRDAPPLSMEEMLNGGCTRHTYINKDGRQKPAHLLIECREFLRLSQALQDRMRTEQPVAGSMAYNAPPPPPNPPANMVQQVHQAAMIQHVVEP
jgi:hypothetical protein